MAHPDRSSPGLSPLLWMAAGGGIALVLIAIVALFSLPAVTSKVEVRATRLPPTAAAEPPSTAIPTFTPSATPTSSATPSPTVSPAPSVTPTAPPTEVPTETPTATATPLPMVRAARDTRLYEGPGSAYLEQGWLVEGKSAAILAQLLGGGWWYVETDRGVRGWVSADAIAIENDVATVPVVTPLPRPAASSTVAQTRTPAPLLGPLRLVELWPVSVHCGGKFEFDLWMKASGGTGVYSYLVNGEVVAKDIALEGVSYHISTPMGTWVGTVSVISGDQQVEQGAGFAPNQFCP